MSVCQQKDISALSLQPASQRSLDGRGRMWQERCFYLDSDITGSPQLPRWLGCAGSTLNALYFESSRKVHTGVFMLYPWLRVPTPNKYLPKGKQCRLITREQSF
ncbi:hypothetical protein XENOCAPTIV_021129 [Xenoophorus captivus]|uniref:Uncharacterized protein n=1 Tax=Xenoophorus captivus TaxID=1517983 RepID=A0ABV0RIC7_9TELE